MEVHLKRKNVAILVLVSINFSIVTNILVPNAVPKFLRKKVFPCFLVKKLMVQRKTTENNTPMARCSETYTSIIYNVNPGLSHVPNLLDFISMEVPSFVVIDHYFGGNEKLQ
jgi:hypothetical protein